MHTTAQRSNTLSEQRNICLYSHEKCNAANEWYGTVEVPYPAGKNMHGQLYFWYGCRYQFRYLYRDTRNITGTNLLYGDIGSKISYFL